MKAVVKLKNISGSPRKMRLLADLVRGLQVNEALDILKYHKKRAYSSNMSKTIASAIASWKEKNGDSQSSEEDLHIKEICVDNARYLKRLQPAPRGRAYRVRKRFNHITVVVDVNNQ